jgi:hypothetical protein
MAGERDEMACDPHAKLETALIDEFLRERGTELRKLRDLPEDQVIRLVSEASAYATARLTEVETRAHFVNELHGTVPAGAPRSKTRSSS